MHTNKRTHDRCVSACTQPCTCTHTDLLSHECECGDMESFVDNATAATTEYKLCHLLIVLSTLLLLLLSLCNLAYAAAAVGVIVCVSSRIFRIMCVCMDCCVSFALVRVVCTCVIMFAGA